MEYKKQTSPRANYAGLRFVLQASACHLRRGHLRERGAAVRRAAAVRQDGAAAARRHAGGLVGGDGVLPGDAAGRLCLCPSADARSCRAAFRRRAYRGDGGRDASRCRSAIAAGWGRPPAQAQEFWLLGLFAASIGLPFFALSANGPLLQAWFARTGHPQAKDPYFLYAASNVGSFLALLAYPFVIEPFSHLPQQTSRLDLSASIC